MAEQLPNSAGSKSAPTKAEGGAAASMVLGIASRGSKPGPVVSGGNTSGGGMPEFGGRLCADGGCDCRDTD